MVYILCAAIAAAAACALAATAVLRRGAARREPGPEPVSAEAEKEAFSMLMGYNADVAYGMRSMGEDGNA